jgi:hypothetical protein
VIECRESVQSGAKHRIRFLGQVDPFSLFSLGNLTDSGDKVRRQRCEYCEGNMIRNKTKTKTKILCERSFVKTRILYTTTTKLGTLFRPISQVMTGIVGCLSRSALVFWRGRLRKTHHQSCSEEDEEDTERYFLIRRFCHYEEHEERSVSTASRR